MVSNAVALASQRPVRAVLAGMGTIWHRVGLRVWLAVARFWRDREGDMLAALNPADCAYSSLTVSVQKKNVEMLSRLLHNALCALFWQAWERYGIVSACAYGWLSLNSGGIGKGTDTAALHPAGGTDSSHIVSVQKKAVSNAGARALQRPVRAVRAGMGTILHCVSLRVWLAVV